MYFKESLSFVSTFYYFLLSLRLRRHLHLQLAFRYCPHLHPSLDAYCFYHHDGDHNSNHDHLRYLYCLEGFRSHHITTTTITTINTSITFIIVGSGGS